LKYAAPESSGGETHVDQNKLSQFTTERKQLLNVEVTLPTVEKVKLSTVESLGLSPLDMANLEFLLEE
jgi:hypothetical protein